MMDDVPNYEVPRRFTQLERRINELWAMIRRSKPQQTTGGTIELVTLTLNTGTGGDATNAANFTYNFTDSTNLSHTNVAPTHQRLNAAKKANIGLFDRTTGKLFWTDETPDAGGCT